MDQEKVEEQIRVEVDVVHQQVKVGGESKMTDEKTYGGVYVGREFSEGTKKDGSAWTKYKLKFQPKGEAQYGFSISAFVPFQDAQTLKVDQLVEGKYYKVVFSESTQLNKYGKPYKQFIRINEAPVDSVQDTPQSTATNQVPNSGIDMGQWEGFHKPYFDTCDKKGIKPSVNHLIGAYMRSYDAKYIEKLVNVATVTVESNADKKAPEVKVEDVV